jgi:hypothetical protein
MRTIFLAYAFRDPDRELAAMVERLLASHNLRAVTGEALGGGSVTPEVQARIQKADGLIALLTRRDQLASGGWTTHDWVRDEIGYARGLNPPKPAIGLREEGVEFGGAWTQNERIDLDRANPAEALLRLSETIGEWKRKAGRLVKVQLLPDNVVSPLVNVNGVTCEYRFVHEGDEVGGADGVKLIGETGGTFIYVRGAQDEYMVKVRIRHPDRRCWASLATSQYLPVTLSVAEGS